MLLKVKLVPSKGEGRRLIEQGGLSINDVKVTNTAEILTIEHFNDGFIIVKKGKKVFNKVILNQ